MLVGLKDVAEQWWQHVTGSSTWVSPQRWTHADITTRLCQDADLVERAGGTTYICSSAPFRS